MPYNIIIGRNKEDKEKFGEKGCIYLGKGYVKMGNYTSLSNKILLDVVRTHVILVAGKRGSGKSYSLGVIAEELSKLPPEVRRNIAPLIFDTMGIFWTMKYKNDKDLELLEQWGLEPKNLPVNVWCPAGFYDEYEKRNIPIDDKFALAVPELNVEDWLSVFKLDLINPVSIIVQNALDSLKDDGDYDIDDIIEKIEKMKNVSKDSQDSGVALFKAAKSWGVFADKGVSPTKIEELVKPGKTSVLDLSVYSSTSSFNIRALIIGLVSKKIFNQRILARKKEEIEMIQRGISSSYEIEREMPLVWLFLDEAHEMLPMHEKTPASDALIQLLREGRQPGISMILATQQPGVIHRDVMTQSDIVLSHKLTNKNDINALNEIMQTYMLSSISKEMNNLPSLKGSAIILDDNSERLYSIRVKPKFTWHGGEAPKSMQEIDKEL